MGRKKTVEELKQAAKAAEERARKLKKQARAATKAEEARTNANVIKAVRAWVQSYPEEKQMDWSEIAAYFYGRAEQNRQKYGKTSNSQTGSEDQGVGSERGPQGHESRDARGGN